MFARNGFTVVKASHVCRNGKEAAARGGARYERFAACEDPTGKILSSLCLTIVASAAKKAVRAKTVPNPPANESESVGSFCRDCQFDKDIPTSRRPDHHQCHSNSFAVRRLGVLLLQPRNRIIKSLRCNGHESGLGRSGSQHCLYGIMHCIRSHIMMSLSPGYRLDR